MTAESQLLFPESPCFSHQGFPFLMYCSIHYTIPYSTGIFFVDCTVHSTVLYTVQQPFLQYYTVYNIQYTTIFSSINSFIRSIFYKCIVCYTVCTVCTLGWVNMYQIFDFSTFSYLGKLVYIQKSRKKQIFADPCKIRGRKLKTVRIFSQGPVQKRLKIEMILRLRKRSCGGLEGVVVV